MCSSASSYAKSQFDTLIFQPTDDKNLLYVPGLGSKPGSYDVLYVFYRKANKEPISLVRLRDCILDYENKQQQQNTKTKFYFKESHQEKFYFKES